MKMSFERKGDADVCYIEGDIDINTSPAIKKAFDKAVEGKPMKVLVNFKDVAYVDSSGLATLVEILKTMRSYGGKLKLVKLSPKIKSLFEITKLEKLFEIFPDEKEALK